MLARLLLLFYASVVNDVHSLVARHDLVSAERLARHYQSQAGATSEVAAAVSWLARGALDAGQTDRAEAFAAESQKMALALLPGRPLDADPWLPVALGASIEVRAQVMAARGERAAAVAMLRKELAAYGGTSIGERLRKNLNLLDLLGKPAPPLEIAEWMGPQPRALSALRGHPVLLFFWAHWCGDCKAEGAVLASLMNTYGSQGLVVVAPTRLYGYAAGGEPAAPATERSYIEQVRRRFYPMLEGVSAPVSSANFLTYGASSTPTLVLIDRMGIVRYYHPGAASEAELSVRIRKILGS